MLLRYMAPHPLPAPHDAAPGHIPPLEQAGLLVILPIAMPPTLDINFLVSADSHFGHGSDELLTWGTISSKTFPHLVHSNS
jgi:hypothetical protein